MSPHQPHPGHSGHADAPVWPLPRVAATLIASFLIANMPILARAEATKPSKPGAPCLAPHEVEASQLYGTWQVRWDDGSAPAQLRFEPHPEWAGSVRGRVQRGGSSALLAGDVDEGELALDESLDGRKISATWSGQVVAPSCGKEIRGTWTDHSSGKRLGFVLSKSAGR